MYVGKITLVLGCYSVFNPFIGIAASSQNELTGRPSTATSSSLGDDELVTQASIFKPFEAEKPCRTSEDCKNISAHHKCLKVPRDCGFEVPNVPNKWRCTVECGGRRCGFGQICIPEVSPKNKNKTERCQCEPGTYRLQSNIGDACFPPYAFVKNLDVKWRILPSKSEADFHVAEKFRTIRVQEGVEVELKCVLECAAFPEPNISWIFSGAVTEITEKHPLVAPLDPQTVQEAFNLRMSQSVIIKAKKPMVDLKSFVCRVGHPALAGQQEDLESEVLVYAVPSESTSRSMNKTERASAESDDGQASAAFSQNGIHIGLVLGILLLVLVAIVIIGLGTWSSLKNRRRGEEEAMGGELSSRWTTTQRLSHRMSILMRNNTISAKSGDETQTGDKWFYAQVLQPGITPITEEQEDTETHLYEELADQQQQPNLRSFRGGMRVTNVSKEC